MTHPLLAYMVVGGTAFAIVALLTPLVSRFALWLDVVDRPDAVRKVHTRAIPRLGGLSFFIAFLVVVLGLEIFAPQYIQTELYPLALCGFFIMLLGIWDDIWDLSSKIKLILEILLCGALYFWGFGSSIIAQPWGGLLHVGPFAILITALWITGVMNAVNFSDGLDGLAAGLVGICALSIFAISWVNGRITSCMVMAFLAGATLAFLLYNFHPASVFMGDAGALFLGFLLGASTLSEQQKGVTVVALTIPVTVMAVPLADTVLSFIRRLRRATKGGFFEADRGHIHHRLLDLGLTQRQAVLALYYLSVCMGLLAFILSGVSNVYRFLALVLAGALILFGAVVLRFMESLAKNGRP